MIAQKTGHRLQVLVYSLIFLGLFLLLPVAYNPPPVFADEIQDLQRRIDVGIW